MWISGPLTQLATAASTGLIATTISPALASLNKATSFKAVFDEWRLLKIRFKLIPSALANGVTKFYLDDADTTTPDRTYIDSVRAVTLSNNSSDPKSTRVLNYRAQDFSDLSWHTTYDQSSVADMALKIYTDNANYNSPTSTNLWSIAWEGYFEFRGVGANQ